MMSYQVSPHASPPMARTEMRSYARRPEKSFVLRRKCRRVFACHASTFDAAWRPRAW